MEYVVYVLIGIGVSTAAYEKEPDELWMHVLMCFTWPVAIGVIIYKLCHKEY